jgi:hypothetical protein
MIVAALTQDRIQQVWDLVELGIPYIRVWTYSDYWLYANLFRRHVEKLASGGSSAGCRVGLCSTIPYF